MPEEKKGIGRPKLRWGIVCRREELEEHGIK
jgi:hypothetical protein